MSVRNKRVSLIDSWKKRYGDDWEERHVVWRAMMSRVTSGENNGMHGYRHDLSAKERIGVRTRGKTLEQIHGIDKASEIRGSISNSMLGAKNPAYGKTYFNGGKSVKGRYKGLFFRSLLEYSFMKHLEFLGYDLHRDVDYECFVIPYELECRERTYRPDFYVKPTSELFEVKPQYVLRKVSSINFAKWSSAERYAQERNMSFFVVSEFDFPKVDFERAKQDVHVVFDERTLKYFRGDLT